MAHRELLVPASRGNGVLTEEQEAGYDKQRNAGSGMRGIRAYAQTKAGFPSIALRASRAANNVVDFPHGVKRGN